MQVRTVSPSRFSAITFLAMGLPFGLAMSATGSSPGYAVVAGLFFGTFMTWFIVGKQPRRDGGVVDVFQSCSLVIPAALEDVRASAESSLHLVLRVREVHTATNGGVVLEGRTPVNWKSWGESVRVELGPAVDGKVPVHVSSRPSVRWTIADYGRNLANVETFADALVHRLPVHAA